MWKQDGKFNKISKKAMNVKIAGETLELELATCHI